MDILFFTRGVLAGRSKESLYYRLHIDKENDSALNLLSNMLWTHFNALSMGLIMASYTTLASRPMTSNIRTNTDRQSQIQRRPISLSGRKKRQST